MKWITKVRKLIGLIQFWYIDGSLWKDNFILSIKCDSTVLVFRVWIFKNQSDKQLLDKLLGSVEYQHSTIASDNWPKTMKMNKQKQNAYRCFGRTMATRANAKIIWAAVWDRVCVCVYVRYSVECKNEQSTTTDHTYTDISAWVLMSVYFDIVYVWV